MAAAGSAESTEVAPGTAPTQPGPSKKYEIEHPDGTTEILGKIKGTGRVEGKVSGRGGTSWMR